MKKLTLICSVLFFSLLPLLAFSQGLWHWQNPYPTGSRLLTVNVRNANTAWVAGVAGAVYKTTNSGITWDCSNVVSSGNTTRHGYSAMKFINDNTGFLGGCQFIIKTTNAGNSWRKVLDYAGCISSIFFIDNNKGWASTIYTSPGKLWRTTNAGENWIQSDSTVGYNYTSIYFVNQYTGYACGLGGILKKTTNGGVNWYNLTSGVGGTLNYIYFANPDTGIALGYSRIKTTNGGLNWTVLSGPNEITSACFVNKDIGCCGNYGGKIYRTTNGGSTWTHVYSAPPFYYYDNVIYSIDISNNGIGYATEYHGRIFKTTNFGSNWTEVSRNFSPPQYCAICNVFWTVNFLNDNTGFAGGKFNKQIARTTNGGNNWEMITIFPTPSDAYSILFPNLNTGYVIAAYDTSYVMKTTNGGYNWFCVNENVIDGYSTGWFVNSNTGFVVGNYNYYNCHRIYKTTNGGENWVVVKDTCPGNIFSMQFVNENTGFVVGNKAGFTPVFAKTTNGGNTWTYLSTPLGNAGALYFLSDLVGFVCSFVNSNGWVSRTTNGGLNWDSAPAVNLYASRNSQWMSFINSNTGFVVGIDGNISFTTNPGANWVNIATGIELDFTGISIPNTNTGYIVGGGMAVLKTTDVGGLITYVHNKGELIPNDISLYQNYPNPFNPITNIEFCLMNNSFVTLRFYDILGREILSSVNSHLNSGVHKYTFDGSHLASGIYFYSLFIDGVRISTKKMMLMK